MMAALLWGAPALAASEGGINALVDRLSTRIDGTLGGTADAERYRPLEAAAPDEARAVVAGASLAKSAEGPDETATLHLQVRMPGKGPRLLLVDAGVVFRGPGGADYVAIPNQRFVLEQPSSEVDVEALPLWPDKPAPPEGSALQVVRSNDPGLIAVLRTVQRLEADDAVRLTRYLKEQDGKLVVDTFLDNQDVHLARWMSWSKDAAGEIRGRLPRDAVRFSIFAVTAGYTIQGMTDWLRLHRALDMNPAISQAWDLAKPVEYVLERAGLNFRVFSPNHAEFHLNQGIAAFRRGDLPAAEKSFRKAMDLDSSLVAARYDLGVTLYRAGKYDEAGEAFLMAAGMKGADADTFFDRGAVLFRLGDKLGAARALRKVLAINPQDPDAPKWLEQADPTGKTKEAPAAAPTKKGRRK
jgi:hypothetical protein